MRIIEKGKKVCDQSQDHRITLLVIPIHTESGRSTSRISRPRGWAAACAGVALSRPRAQCLATEPAAAEHHHGSSTTSERCQRSSSSSLTSGPSRHTVRVRERKKGTGARHRINKRVATPRAIVPTVYIVPSCYENRIVPSKSLE